MSKPKFDLDYKVINEAITRKDKLEEKVSLQQKRVLFSQHKDRFTKVAWDLWQLKDAPEVQIWQLEDPDGEGNRYISRLGDWEEEEESRTKWSTTASQDQSFITISYKSVPITKLATKDFGVEEGDMDTFQHSIIEHLQDKKHVREMLEETVGPEYRKALEENFPELV